MSVNTELIKKIKDKYLIRDFKLLLAEEDSLYFSNKFSRHFIFIFDSVDALERNWGDMHKRLIDDYIAFDGPKDMEWNFYAIFVISQLKADERSLLADVRSKIQSDKSYSRKYVYEDGDLEDLPPGIIIKDDLKSGSWSTDNIYLSWEKTLGKKFFDLIVTDTKQDIFKRIEDFLRKSDG